MQTTHFGKAKDTGLIVLNARGRQLFVNARARALVAWHFPSPDGKRSSGGFLATCLAHGMTGAQEAGGVVCESLRFGGDARGLRVRVVKTKLEIILLLEEEGDSTVGPAPEIAALSALGVTRREAEVLRWVAEGKSNSDIGAILHIALRTVKKHLEHILDKLGVENRTSAAARASEVLHRCIVRRRRQGEGGSTLSTPMTKVGSGERVPV